ncbi:unannotated protein [freshwater metagenome]|uniref:Unannotated protein n=1 Tax=freshwater metagenome TaxID=449393 RepID=A0A6J5ZR84_9ZZZZ|nr:pilus assembly protein TadB [Actinomycetota bacterium]MSW26511.1 pilus assembly protein TadB [Actinomycetota bacterium]MSW33558.1 pilus assembly protein TadB [Actinomycetota bacterium]MSX30582.1 pilus assembly protein TadB [Actinomycetota bacterium]MSX51439.1 pilus assembly protein TadB [Actinomycetota bacterium]
MNSKQILIPLLLAAVGALLLIVDTDSSLSRIKRLPDSSGVRTRLARIGQEAAYETFRVKQVSKALLAAAIALFIGLVIARSFVLGLVLAISTCAATFLLVDRQLSKEVIRYRASIESEFPSIIEMLTLALSAGETPLGAMTRISERSHGLLAFEFRTVVESVRLGAPFHLALDGLGRRVESDVIRRFVDALITAMLRGAPLIDVLQRHAAEARQIQRNHLMDKAGKAEISMMIPVVFLILPVSILFALWPSINHLNLFAA